MLLPPYVYPIKGITFFLSHPQLWIKALCPFLLTLIFGIASLVLCFVFLLPLQAHALIQAHCPEWLAWLVSVIFVLLESCIIDLLFYFAIMLPMFQDVLFDCTLRAAGLERMFETRVPVSTVMVCCRGVSSGLVMVWFLILAQVFILILTAPLNLIPVAGTVIACYINGWLTCWGLHLHYDLEFRGFSVSESRAFAWKYKSHYSQFGAVAVALELVPLFNLIFMWTNIVGAALYVGDQYRKNEKSMEKQQQSEIEKQQYQSESSNTKGFSEA